MNDPLTPKPCFIDLSSLRALPQKPHPLQSGPIRIRRVVPFIYLSDSRAAENIQEIAENNIRYVVYLSKPKKTKRKTNLYNQINCYVSNSPNADITVTLRRLVKIIKAIVSHRHSVLICCSTGLSLSPTVVIAYRGKAKKLSFQDCFDILQQFESRIGPSLSHLLQLKKLEKKIQSTKT